MESVIHVGVNSYVTLEEAKNYVALKPSDSPLLMAWNKEGLTDEDRERYLIESAMALNNLKYTGKKKIRGQVLAFPRCANQSVGFWYNPYGVYQKADLSLMDGLTSGGDGLDSAKRAQIENTLAHIAIGNKSITTMQKRRLSGLVSKRSDDISEGYDNNSLNSEDALIGLYAPELVKVILKSWLTLSVYSL